MSAETGLAAGNDLIFAVNVGAALTVVLEAVDVVAASERAHHIFLGFRGVAKGWSPNEEALARIANREEVEAFEAAKASWNGEVRLAAIFFDHT